MMNRQHEISSRGRQDGAAMLMVLMVLLMTTATATFAIHSTTMEMRSAGYGRQAMQTNYVAEGGANAGLAYIDAIGAQATFIQYTRTSVDANVPFVPGSTSVDRRTNVLRIAMSDFQSDVGAYAPPIETTGAPSLGARTLYQPSFFIDGTDFYRSRRQVAGRAQDGRDPMAYVRLNVTSRGSMALASDGRLTGDLRDIHETVVHARAMAEMGPFGGGF